MLPGEKIEFSVFGVPKPQGSKRPFKTKSGAVVVVESCKEGWRWSESVKVAFLERFRELDFPLIPHGHPVAVRCEFRMPRPKHHFRSDGVRLKESAPAWHTDVPDLTKIWRRTEDALAGLLWADDKQVAAGAQLSKRYCRPGEGPGCDLLAVWVREGVPSYTPAIIPGFGDLPLFEVSE